jgi:hypothetical protein
MAGRPRLLLNPQRSLAVGILFLSEKVSSIRSPVQGRLTGMFPSICPRCALSLSKNTRVPKRIQLPNAEIIRRASTTTRAPYDLPSVSSTNTINQFQLPQQLRHLYQTLESFPDIPYPTETLSRSFVTTANSITLPLLQALAIEDNAVLWDRYIELRNNGDLKYINRPHFSYVLRALHPVRPFNGEYNDPEEFIKRIDCVKSDMQGLGYELTQADWGHIIDCGRVISKKSKPDQIYNWWDELRCSMVKPDVWTYNHFLASVCGLSTSLQSERPIQYQVGIDGEIKSLGKSIADNPNLWQREPIIGMSSVANRIVRDMVSRSLTPTAYTYELLITAYARDNNLDVVTEIIQRIWGINADGTQTAEPGSASRSVGSSLLPSQHTLTAIANAYGYNGALPSAIATIDAMSQKFDVVIPVSTWLALLLWTSRRSTIHKAPRLGFLPPSAAPRLFKIMTSPPYNVSPGLEAYWLMINHQRKRNNFRSCDFLLVDLLKRYGHNGTDLTPENKHIAKLAMYGVQIWVPILCHNLATRGRDKVRAIATHIRWQQRFHLLETTGLMREWDEFDDSRKTGAFGIFKTPTGTKQTSYSIRKQLAQKSRDRRLSGYGREQERRRKDYAAWHPRRFLFVPFGARFKVGLGAPRKYFQRSYQLWKLHMQGVFTAKDESAMRLKLTELYKMRSKMRKTMKKNEKRAREETGEFTTGRGETNRHKSRYSLREQTLEKRSGKIVELEAWPKFQSSVRDYADVKGYAKEEAQSPPSLRNSGVEQNEDVGKLDLEGLFVKDDGQSAQGALNGTGMTENRGRLTDQMMDLFPKGDGKE